jgi:hypothetical protein
MGPLFGETNDGLGTFTFYRALTTIWKGLHDADFSHRHEVPIERVRVLPRDWQIVDAHKQFRIGQSTGTY